MSSSTKPSQLPTPHDDAAAADLEMGPPPAPLASVPGLADARETMDAARDFDSQSRRSLNTINEGPFHPHNVGAYRPSVGRADKHKSNIR